MAVANSLRSAPAKRRVLYGAMILAGAIFVSTLVLPVSAPVARIIAALSFGVMSGLWLSHLVHSL